MATQNKNKEENKLILLWVNKKKMISIKLCAYDWLKNAEKSASFSAGKYKKKIFLNWKFNFEMILKENYY